MYVYIYIYMYIYFEGKNGLSDIQFDKLRSVSIKVPVVIIYVFNAAIK
jgi:hypothetical protein